MLLLLLMACSHQDGESEAKQTMLRLYVYAPERPIQTRVNKGDVDATEAEGTIHQLQVWVFRRKDGRLVTYFKPQSTVLTRADLKLPPDKSVCIVVGYRLDEEVDE